MSNGKTVAESILKNIANAPPRMEKLPKMNEIKNTKTKITLLIFCGFIAIIIPTAKAKTDIYHIDQQSKKWHRVK